MEGSNSQEKLISSHNDSFALTIQGTLTDSMESHVVLYRCCVRNADGVGSSPSVRLNILRKGNKKRSFEEASSRVLWSSSIVTFGGVVASWLVSSSPDCMYQIPVYPVYSRPSTQKTIFLRGGARDIGQDTLLLQCLSPAKVYKWY